jgi:hypothetical protein
MAWGLTSSRAIRMARQQKVLHHVKDWQRVATRSSPHLGEGGEQL